MLVVALAVFWGARLQAQSQDSQLIITSTGYYPATHFLTELLVLRQHESSIHWEGELFHERVRGQYQYTESEFGNFAKQLSTDLTAIAREDKERSDRYSLANGIVSFAYLRNGEIQWSKSLPADRLNAGLPSSAAQRDLLVQIARSRSRSPGLIGSYLLSFLGPENRSLGQKIRSK